MILIEPKFGKVDFKLELSVISIIEKQGKIVFMCRELMKARSADMQQPLLRNSVITMNLVPKLSFFASKIRHYEFLFYIISALVQYTSSVQKYCCQNKLFCSNSHRRKGQKPWKLPKNPIFQAKIRHYRFFLQIFTKVQ